MNRCSMFAILVLSSVAMGGPAEQPKMYYADTSHGRSFAKDPDVEWFGGRYLMYYSVHRGQDGFAVGIAESSDLTRWRKVGEVLPAADYERKGLAAPAALVRGGKLHLFYQTYGNGRDDAICHAVSEDGIHFTRNATNPIFRPTGDWNCGRAIDAEVIEHKGKLLLYCATRDPEMKVQKLVVASAPADSDYGRDKWTQLCDRSILEPQLPWEKNCIEAPALCTRNGRLFMFYAGGYNNEPQQIGCAVSDDGIAWTRLSQHPLLPNGGPEEWNSSESGHPGAFTDRDGQMHLFFQGNNDNGKSWYLSRMKIAWDAGDRPYLIRPRDGQLFQLK
ncbi:MAG TPA: family 43 glycosylhydrolase [Sedimentisphaerales bacterium]|nr:family 43 glycosylhydrolase [Sedimentisphaerales bacterium]